MGYSRTPSTRSRFVFGGFAYGICFFIFLGLVMILEPRMRGSYWRGWEIISWGIGVMALAFFGVGVSLLTWIFWRHLPSMSKGNASGRTPLYPGVWDQQLDG
jgi:threonine/homoserine/homoserine lactone efflux protein